MGLSIKINLNKTTGENETNLLFSINGLPNRIRITTGINCIPKNWNNETQKIKRSDKDFGNKNRILARRQSELSDTVFGLQTNEISVTNAEIKKRISWVNEAAEKTTPYQQLRSEFLEHKKREVRETTFRKKYLSPFNVLDEFVKATGVKINVHTFGEDDFNKLEDYCIGTRRNTNNGFDKTVAVLKTFLKWCNEKGYTANNYHSKIKRPATASNKTTIHPLLLEELQTLENANATFTGLKEDVRNTFLFQCYTGLRFSDIFKVKKSHIDNEMIKIVTEKTQKPVKIPLLNRTKEIIAKYRAEQRDNIFMPIANPVFNRYLKEIFRELDLKRPIEVATYIRKETIRETKPICDLISSHDGRRTFITLSLKAGMNAWQLMTITGHEQFETFKKYVSFTDEEIRNRFFEVWKDKET